MVALRDYRYVIPFGGLLNWAEFWTNIAVFIEILNEGVEFMRSHLMHQCHRPHLIKESSHGRLV
jgi:hypothetical protein